MICSIGKKVIQTRPAHFTLGLGRYIFELVYSGHILTTDMIVREHMHAIVWPKILFSKLLEPQDLQP